MEDVVLYLRDVCRPMCCHPKSSNSNFGWRCLWQYVRSMVVDTLGIHFRCTILTFQIHVSFHFTTECTRVTRSVSLMPHSRKLNKFVRVFVFFSLFQRKRKQMAKIKSIVWSQFDYFRIAPIESIVFSPLLHTLQQIKLKYMNILYCLQRMNTNGMHVSHMNIIEKFPSLLPRSSTPKWKNFGIVSLSAWEFVVGTPLDRCLQCSRYMQIYDNSHNHDMRHFFLSPKFYLFFLRTKQIEWYACRRHKIIIDV